MILFREDWLTLDEQLGAGGPSAAVRRRQRTPAAACRTAPAPGQRQRSARSRRSPPRSPRLAGRAAVGRRLWLVGLRAIGSVGALLGLLSVLLLPDH
ncbi:MAG TPA: hypothetical protein VFS21_30950 [Roseiflexaceae bacterium]|nr:hypothetical protein [Roseiflexaceae bacterium]